MKKLIKLLFILLIVAQLQGQEQNIETKSVAIDDLISFLVENYNNQETQQQNITFLIQTNDNFLEAENKILLKQAFKILSERLTENSKISLVTYSKFSGLALKPTSPNELKLILHTLSDLKGNISEFHGDGIQLAYNHTKQNFIENAVNTVVMIRIHNKPQSEVVNVNQQKKAEDKAKKKKSKNVLLVTAIGLLPELISLIKD